MIAESGIGSRAQAAAAELAGADAVLVGSALMRAGDPAGELRDLLARPLVKVCGLTREADVAAAAEAGADLAGFVLAESPRRAERVLPVPETMLSVAVVVGEDADYPADLVQRYDERERASRARRRPAQGRAGGGARRRPCRGRTMIPSTWSGRAQLAGG